MRPIALIACVPVVLALACTDDSPGRSPRDAAGGMLDDADMERADAQSEALDAASASEAPRDAGAPQLAFDGGENELDAAMNALDAAPPWPLGMNDVTILTPVPSSSSSRVLLGGEDPADDGQPLVPRALFDLLMNEGSCNSLSDAGACAPDQFPPLTSRDYAALHLTGLRFDLCDRKLPGRCAATADGSLRAVFQPTVGPDRTDFNDSALHAVYAIPHAQLPEVLAELRRLARLQAEPLASPLKVSPALADREKVAYRDGLRALVRKYARSEKLIRLAHGHGFSSAYGRWLMRAVERAQDGTFQLRVIPGSSATSQHIHNRFRQGFEVEPASDAPTGLTAVLFGFWSADGPRQRELLELLRAIEDPNKHGFDDMSCVSCHVATDLLERHAVNLGIDAGSVAGAYDGGAYNLSLEASQRKRTFGTVLQLGYWMNEPVLSQRVVNETAQVLTEIEQRFR